MRDSAKVAAEIEQVAGRIAKWVAEFREHPERTSGFELVQDIWPVLHEARGLGDADVRDALQTLVKGMPAETPESIKMLAIVALRENGGSEDFLWTVAGGKDWDTELQVYASQVLLFEADEKTIDRVSALLEGRGESAVHTLKLEIEALKRIRKQYEDASTTPEKLAVLFDRLRRVSGVALADLDEAHLYIGLKPDLHWARRRLYDLSVAEPEVVAKAMVAFQPPPPSKIIVDDQAGMHAPVWPGVPAESVTRECRVMVVQLLAAPETDEPTEEELFGDLQDQPRLYETEHE